jgi:hypothetical protein
MQAGLISEEDLQAALAGIAWSSYRSEQSVEALGGPSTEIRWLNGRFARDAPVGPSSHKNAKLKLDHCLGMGLARAPARRLQNSA